MKKQINLKNIQKSAGQLSLLTEQVKNNFLSQLEKELQKRKREIMEANKIDTENAGSNGCETAFIQRLTLDVSGIKKMIDRLKEVRKLQSGLGEIMEEKISHGLKIQKVRTPLGVIMVIYEARPEVTIDVVALCIKSGNAAILKGGSEAINTNLMLYQCIKEALEKSKIGNESVTFINTSERRFINNLLKQNQFIDLVIARGGYGLVKAVQQNSTIPVLAHSAGGARIYVDKSADLSLAEKVIVNAKTSKPAACNSLDTIVIHQYIADKFIPQITDVLEKKYVKVIGQKEATESDWDKEFLGLTVAIKVVKDANQAVNFINRYGKKHSEGVVAKDKKVIAYFKDSIDAASIFVNCSTRLHDGYIFGLGSEMGIATGKLHARGPVGLKELTTYKWIITGNGQTRI